MRRWGNLIRNFLQASVVSVGHVHSGVVDLVLLPVEYIYNNNVRQTWKNEGSSSETAWSEKTGQFNVQNDGQMVRRSITAFTWARGAPVRD